MYALKRMIAYAIDLVCVIGPLAAVMSLLEGWLFGQVPEHMHMFLSLGRLGIGLIAPALVLGILTGLTGWTPGKLVTFLRVKDCTGEPPGIAEGILREVLKLVSLGFFLGTIYALQGIVTRGRTFYDDWMDLDVEDLKPTGLTETQRNYRKYMREQARKGRV